MAENSKDEPVQQPSSVKPEAPQLRRRLFIFRATAILSAAAASALGVFGTPSARAQITDTDAGDPRGRGRGGTRRGGGDNDPDAPSPGATVTDRDPDDPQRRPRSQPRRALGRDGAHPPRGPTSHDSTGP